MDRFDFTLSIGRLGYLGRMVLDFFILVIIGATLNPEDPSYFSLGVMLLVFAANFVAQIQRLNSANANRWWSLLYFLPVVCIPFLLAMLFMRPAEYEESEDETVETEPA